MNIRQIFSAALCAVSTLLAACGGGGRESSTMAGINGGGVTAPGVAVGPITGFGSIFVNGIEFDLTGSTITVDGQRSGQTDLRIGQVVTVRGSINQNTGRGTATSVDYHNNLRGVVESVDANTNTFVVIGQTVTVTGATVFQGLASLAALTSAGVEVSGFVNNQGKIVATLVEAIPISSGQWELTGKVSLLDQQSFKLDTTTVNYAMAPATINGSLANQVCVEVKGTFNANVLFANTIQVKDCNLSTANNDIGEIEGIITAPVSGANVFALGSVSVSIAGSPQYVNGSVADLVPGASVEVEGSFSGGVLTARKIEIKGTDVRMSGLVEDINTTAKTLSLFGVSVATSASTQFVNKLGQSNAPYSLSDVHTGEFVEVRGYENPTHTAMTAVMLEHRIPDDRLEIQTTASNVSTASRVFKLFGSINVDTTNVSNMPTGFFTTGNNALVQVRGPANAWSRPTFMANSVSIESPR